MIENNISKVSNDVNEYIFLLQKYSVQSNQINEQTKQAIKKYTDEEAGRKIKEKQKELLKERAKEAEKNAIYEFDNEFSVADTYGNIETVGDDDEDLGSLFNSGRRGSNKVSIMRSQSGLKTKLESLRQDSSGSSTTPLKTGIAVQS